MTHRVVATAAVLLLLVAAGSPGQAGLVDCQGVSPVSNTTLTRVTVASGLPSAPLLVTAPRYDPNRIFILLQNGTIRVLERGAAPTAHTLFLDIDDRVLSGDEQGLLGMAFDPYFYDRGYFYLSYTRNGDGDTIISRFQTFGGDHLALADPNSETILMRIDDPHPQLNGGNMAFGPDLYLYIGTGDGGGGAGDAGAGHAACGNGQSTQNLPPAAPSSGMLGKLLRIDPLALPALAPDCGLDAANYTIPFDNPLADGPGGDCDEIWAYGLRNPWRWSFDPANRDLYVGDVGQGCWEEINYVSSASLGGENYGWRLFEGRHCYNASQGCTASTSPGGCLPACSDPLPSGDPNPNGTVLPVWNYDSNGGNCAVTGGHVYRGCRMPNFHGRYFYGDYCAGSVLSFEVQGGAAVNHQNWTPQLGAGLTFDLTSFGTDGQGEIYIADEGGLVYKIVPLLSDFEVSGVGAEEFRLSKNGDWTWEDLQYSSSHPITSYRVYRAEVSDGLFQAGEIFDCVQTTLTPTWPAGGDLTIPAQGELLAYVVTALNAGGAQTSPGGTPLRTLGAAACP